MTEEFPSQAYSSAQEKWLGRDHLITPTILKALGETLKNAKVLDVGCGNGHYSIDFIRDHGAQSVVGVDSSPEMITICQQSSNQHLNDEMRRRIEFRCESAVELNDTNGEFDVVTAFFVLQFIHDKEQLRQAIKKIGKALKQKGIFYGLVPNGIRGIRPTKEMGQKLGASLEIPENHKFVDGELVEVNFYENGEVCGNTTIALHSREFYETCFKEAGFNKVEWIAPHFSEYGRKVLGDEFCEGYLNPPCDVLFKCSK